MNEDEFGLIDEGSNLVSLADFVAQSDDNFDEDLAKMIGRHIILNEGIEKLDDYIAFYNARLR